jgi:hypothetical protein
MGLVVFGLLAGVSQAWAAEVVEVRVGRHPNFTRVVFELDRSAGYRIERSDPSSKESELIISLEAGSIPRRIQSTKSFIEQVVVEPSGTRSIARIRLARGGLRLKEMILASPPRIVLDVIAEDGTPALTTAATKAATPAKTPSTAPTTKAVTATTAATKPTPSTAPATKLATPIAKAGPVVKPAPTLAAAPTPKAKAQPSATPAPAPKTKVLASTETAGARAATSPTPAVSPSEWNDGGTASGSGAPADPNAAALVGGSADAADAASTAAADAAAEKPKARPMMVKSSDRDDAEEGGGLMTWTLAGLGLAAAAFGGLVVARRRRASADEDDAEGDAESPFEDDAVADRSAASDTSNPFAELTGGSASLASGMTSGTASTPRPAAKLTAKQEKKPSESLLFDDAEEKTMENMEVISRSQVNESLGGAMPMMGGGSDEVAQMFREMQRRVAALEGRIDELVDARDRLERQVAAQTEELRVQRAAIARTQRAVRNLARPEEGNEDEPTEPALRDPN